MIDSFYIESAKRIRTEYLSLNRSLEKYQTDLREISELLIKTAHELDEYNKKDLRKETSFESIKNYIFGKLDHLDAESNKLAKKINPINDAIEKLKQDELNLYQVLRTKYSNLTDDQIRQEIQKHLVE